MYKEFAEGVFLFDYYLNSWISTRGENIGTIFNHKKLGLIFKSRVADPGQSSWYTHPKFGKMPGHIEISKHQDLFPFISQDSQLWSVVSFAENGQSQVWDSKQKFNGNLNQVWEMLKMLEGDNPTRILDVITTHQWIPPDKINYIKGRLVFGLPVR